MKMTTLLGLPILAVGVSGIAQAQIFRCQGLDGRVTYSQAPCEGRGRLLDSRKSVAPDPDAAPARAYSTDAPARQPAQPNAQQTPSPASPQCPSELDVKNIETSASSIRHDAHDRQVWQEQIRRARACEPLMTEWQMKTMKEELRTRARAARASRPQAPAIITNCDPAGCWDTQGRRYDNAAGGMFRQDGAFCERMANTLRCQ